MYFLKKIKGPNMLEHYSGLLLGPFLFRYAGILREVLDRVEDKQPPSQSDEENCDVRYRIEPSSKGSYFLSKVSEETLMF